ncbi:MAG: T9SS type A sorting domain-containing protein [Saprospiraceae bacterium]
MNFSTLKKSTTLLFCCLFQLALSAQQPGLGDIAITGYNADADPNNAAITDDFSFVLLTATSSGSVISFTDQGWLASGGFRTGEGTLVLTFTSAHSCGSEFRLFEENGVWKATSLTGGGHPTLSETGDFSLSSSGDQIIVYATALAPTQGNDPNFITALQFAGPWQADATDNVESAQPAIFAANPGNDFVVDPHLDNGKYNCFINAGEPAALRATIYTLSNWGFDNSSANRFDLTTPCSFTCQGVCTPSMIASVSSNAANNTFCTGEEVIITIEGSLNSATLWTINNGSCDGPQAGTTSTNTISFTATKTTTYFISGFGGCVVQLDCTPITIIVDGVVANAGPDQRLPAGVNTTSLQANAAGSGTGTWHLVDPGDGNAMISDLHSPTTAFSGSPGQRYVLAWTIATPSCTNESSDEVAITFLEPTTLHLGEIVFTGYNADENDFSFALLTSVNAGTRISFTENGWLATGGFRPGENTFTFEFDRAYDCGSEFIVYDLPNLDIRDRQGVIAGQILSGSFLNLSTSGDQIFIYQGTVPSTGNETGFITAIQMNGAWDADATNSSESAKPAVFTDGLNALSITPQAQNAKYNCNINAGAPGELQATVNTVSNWEMGSDPFPLDGNNFCDFSCVDCILPVLESVDVPTIDPCPGVSITIAITGSLNGAAEWAVYTGECGSTLLGTTTANTIDIIPPASGLLFVGARGGCVSTPVCLSAGITLGGILADAGPDQKISNVTTTTLMANSAQGSGTWSFADPGDGLGVISDPNSPVSSFSGTAGQTYTLIWTLSASNACSSSSDEVQIAFFNPTTLTLGDLVFIAYSADTDDFAFTLLKDVDAGTTIRFTDRGWLANGGFREGEGTLVIELCRPYQCGDELDVFDLTQEVRDARGKIAGSVSGTPLDLSTSGDQIFAFQGIEPSATDQSSFIAAIHMNGEWDTGDIGAVESNLPAIFTNGVNAVAITPESDNAYFDCTGSGPMDPEATRTAVNNTANWIKDDAVSATLPLNCVLRCCDDYVMVSISGVEETPYCPGEVVKLTVNGELRGAADWVWYEGGCGQGVPIGSGTSINYTVTSAVTIFVRGENGCMNINENCLSVSIAIENIPPIALCKNLTIQAGTSFAPEEIDNGSSDDCDIASLSLSDTTFACTQLGENLVTLTVVDAAGLSSACSAIVTVEGPDEDCDLVADECDQCPGGDDKVDVDNNGVADCTEFSALENVLEAWKCGPNLDSVFICSIVNGDPTSAQTYCVPPEAVNDILTAGGYLGPCGNTPCGAITATVATRPNYRLSVFPNPTNHMLYVELELHQPMKGEISLYNTIGQVVSRQSIPAHTRHLTYQIPTKKLENGLFLLQIQLGDHTIIREKVLVNR